MKHQTFNPSMLAISIVSHGQGPLIRQLLKDLQPLMHAGADVLLTLNLPEDETFIGGFEDSLTVIRNTAPKGFGENHNCANMQTNRYWFAVLNPDIRCEPSIFTALAAAHLKAHAGVTAPRVIGTSGHDEDSVRYYPSLLRIFMRVWGRLLDRRLTADYTLDDEKIKVVDWAAGMFLLFKTDDYRRIGGFDTRYFMYLEDADICRRLSSTGLPAIVVPAVSVVHDARRATGYSLKHLRWHLASMVRFLIVAPWSRPQPALPEQAAVTVNRLTLQSKENN